MVHYNSDEEQLSPKPDATFTTIPGSFNIVLSLSGLTCAACVATVEHALCGLEGVKEARVSLPLQEATVIGKEGHPIDKDSLLKVVREAGYNAVIGRRTPQEMVEISQLKKDIALLKSALGNSSIYAANVQGLLSMSNWFLGTSASALAARWCLHTASLVLTTLCQYRHLAWIHQEGWKRILKRNPNMNSLLSMTIVLGLLFSTAGLLICGPQMESSYQTAINGLTLIFLSARCLEALSRKKKSQSPGPTFTAH
ncbi:hypothetical protein ASPSYDRAFT_134974 [Aspergillus sydowii CBS 593.65]|uniref:HMA domain-containing protein n=1 Tax=Aspergillus sydowii CBS 593.65 TaxID=1036612 RepID=A0A1L9TA12_9EURO|nr:uncharacterized protein ASPSYDRAFT_134974 [Aspergillus sydowii CBS 593.65]OJJ56256.1 hypothetical protein ASPSYDRAFT_134974 [Aspergillus sydowii CBS 593.65]